VGVAAREDAADADDRQFSGAQAVDLADELGRARPQRRTAEAPASLLLVGGDAGARDRRVGRDDAGGRLADELDERGEELVVQVRRKFYEEGFLLRIRPRDR